MKKAELENRVVVLESVVDSFTALNTSLVAVIEMFVERDNKHLDKNGKFMKKTEYQELLQAIHLALQASLGDEVSIENIIEIMGDSNEEA